MGEKTEIYGELRVFYNEGDEVAQEAILDQEFIRFEIPTTPPFINREVSDLSETRFGKVLWSENESGERLRAAHPGEIALHKIEWFNGVTEVLETDQIRVKSDSPNGLHLLQTGDHLTVYDRVNPEVVAWQGVVKLLSSGGPDVNPKRWASWFLKQHPALLVRPDGIDTRESE